MSKVNEEVVEVVEGEVVEKESKLTRVKGFVRNNWKKVAVCTGIAVVSYMTGNAVGKSSNCSESDMYIEDNSDDQDSNDEVEL